jgi:hypothetical protein
MPIWLNRLSVPPLTHSPTSAEHAQRHRQHDHQRVGETLELRGQHQIHHQQRHAEGQQYRAAGLLVLARLALPVQLRVFGQLARHLLRPRDCIAQPVTRCQTGTDGDRTKRSKRFSVPARPLRSA